MSDTQIKPRSNKRLLAMLLGFTIGMFGFGYALVPLYNVMCKVLGINGKTGGQVSIETSRVHVDKSRTIRVEFLTSVNSNLPWKFHPKVNSVTLHPGEMRLVNFFAENDTDKTMTIQAIPSVAPGIVAKYLKKTECFCFTQQTLKAHESMDMPVLFHLDPAIPKEIHEMTLSYTLFDVTNRNFKKNDNAGKLG